MKSISVLWVMLFIHEIAHKTVHDLKEIFHYKANLFTLLILSLCTSVLTLFVMCNFCAHLICKQPVPSIAILYASCLFQQAETNTYIHICIYIHMHAYTCAHTHPRTRSYTCMQQDSVREVRPHRHLLIKWPNFSLACLMTKSQQIFGYYVK